MKRIVLLAMVMLALVSSITKARGYGYSSVRYHVRWSPYAFRHGRSGLISGDVYYSPYAFRFGHSGLIRDDVRYSPYAFDYKHSGLVADSGCCYSCYPVCYSCCPSNGIYITNWEICHASTQPDQSFEEQKKDYQEKMRARRARIEKLVQERRAAKADDGEKIIYDYLKSKNIPFKIRNRLSVQANTLCSEFLLGDGSLLIKYRNSEAIEQAKKNPRYNEFYEKYQQDWTEFCQQYKGKIYEINSAN